MHTVHDFILLPLIFILMFGVTKLCCFLLKGKREQVRRIPFIVITALLLILEVLKQIVSFTQGYNLWHIPLHICSSVMFFFPFACFAKPNSRISEIGFALSLSIGGVISIGVYGFTSLIIGNVSEQIFSGIATFFSYHALAFHNLVILFVMLGIALKPYKPNPKDIKWTFIVFGAFILFAAVMAHTLATDFARFLNFPFPWVESLHGIPFLYSFAIWFIYMFMCFCGTFLAIIAPRLITKHNEAKHNEAKDDSLQQPV